MYLILGAPVQDTIPLLERAPWKRAALISAVAFVATLLVHCFVIQQFPNSADEYAYLWQAQVYASGHLTAEIPEPRAAFEFFHLGDLNGHRFSRFPPGWSLLLVPGVWLGFPGLMTALLGSLTLGGIYRLGCAWIGPREAAWGTLLTGLSPFFLLNVGSLHSHAACLFALTALALSLTWHRETGCRETGYRETGRRETGCRETERRETGHRSALFLAGVSLGLAVLIRPFSALLLGVPLLVHHGLELKRRGRLEFKWRGRLELPGWTLMALGGAPFALFLAWNNHVVTGDWLLLPTRLYDPSEGLGFGVHGHSLQQGLQTTLLWWVEGLAYCFFLSPLLLIAARGQLKGNPHRRLLWGLMAAPVLGYLFYWNPGGERYGPRFYFEGLLPFTLLVGVGLTRLLNTGRNRGLLVGAGVFGLIVLGKHFVDIHSQIEARQDLYRTVDAAQLEQAVVLLLSGSADMISLDLTRNPPDFRLAPVLYARGQGADDRLMGEAFPDRTLYYYRWSELGSRLWPVPASIHKARPDK